MGKQLTADEMKILAIVQSLENLLQALSDPVLAQILARHAPFKEHIDALKKMLNKPKV